MNMKRFMKDHEARINHQLRDNVPENDRHELRETHERMIGYIKHERLVHLIVTVAFAGFLLITLAIALIKPTLPILLLLGMFFVLLVPYIIHYRYLENTVQRWYGLSERLAAVIRRP